MRIFKIADARLKGSSSYMTLLHINYVNNILNIFKTCMKLFPFVITLTEIG